jgi:hypothetical protein
MREYLVFKTFSLFVLGFSLRFFSVMKWITPTPNCKKATAKSPMENSEHTGIINRWFVPAAMRNKLVGLTAVLNTLFS